MFPLIHGVVSKTPTASTGTIFDESFVFPVDAVFELTNDGKSARLTNTVSEEEYIGVSTSKSSGKWYIEYQINPNQSATQGVLFGTDSFTGGDDFNNTESFLYRAQQVVAYGNYVGTNGFTAPVATDIIGIALDFDTLTATYYKNGAASTRLVTMRDEAHRMYYSCQKSQGRVCTIYTTASEITHLPSGFLPWDG